MGGNRLWFSSLSEQFLVAPDRGRSPRLYASGPNLLTGFESGVAQGPSADALDIDFAGYVRDAKVTLAIRPKIEHAYMGKINGIIVHQTGGSNAKGSLSSYEKDGANGAHFLIDKDGTIYQTASVYKSCHHVGNLKSRCMAEKRCTATELKALDKKGPGRPIGRVEAEKSWPDRYPGNSDSIGIEIVGKDIKATEAERKKYGVDTVYEPLTEAQQTSFGWLLRKLAATLQVQMTEVFTHPTVSWKNPTEGSSAQW